MKELKVSAERSHRYPTYPSRAQGVNGGNSILSLQQSSEGEVCWVEREKPIDCMAQAEI